MIEAPALAPIPVVDVREGGPVRHAREAADRARALRADCLGFLPGAVAPVVPVLDRAARRWLERSSSPYVGEVAEIAGAVGVSGIWLLNGSYQWGCTTLACRQGEANWLVRTLDWPFRGMGRHAAVARMAGPAGEFVHVTWPGYVGALTAMAPGRFAAAVNQAPMWRRSRQRWLRGYDLVANAVHTFMHVRHMPPDQLLRQVFETCQTYAQARAKLETVPVARPVIFTLAGCGPHERCVIERTEDAFTTREEETSAANDWLEPSPRWEARLGGRNVITASFAEAAEHSHARRTALAGFAGSLEDFAWVAPPVLNPFTRLAVAMNPERGILSVLGYERLRSGQLPEPVTRVCEIRPA